MKNLISFSNYEPDEEYKSDSRREMNLNPVRRSAEFKELLRMGFEEVTSDQQELNSTLKFVRVKNKDKDRGHDYPFYTIHPTGTVRRYNPPRGEEIPEGSGNEIKIFPKPFIRWKDYIKALRYLIKYLKRKEERGDFK